MRNVVRIVQFAVAVVFIFSGLVKCIDPVGTSIKITEYLQYFGFGMLTDLSMGLAWLLCIAEFLCGVNLLLGHARILTLLVSSLLMLVFTPLTLWLAMTEAIQDCGCFGDAVHLTNGQTFAKNLVLDAMLVLLWLRRSLMYRLLGSTFYFVNIYWLFGCVVWLCWLGTWREPFIDFRPFKPGTDLKAAVMGEGQLQEDKARSSYICVYEKDGVRQQFPLEELPSEEEGWTFVETIEVPNDDRSDDREGAGSNEHIDFFVLDAEGNVITDSILSRPGYTFLLLSHSLDKASQHDIDRIEQLSEYAEDNGYAFLCLTARDPRQLERWKFNTGAEYRFVFTDVTIVETICRSNPGVMLLHDGIILWKRPLSILDTEGLASGKLNEQSSGDIEEIDQQNRFLSLLVLLFAPFILFLLVEIPKTIHKLTSKKDSKNA